ncbi:MAG TPA: signal peptidase II [Candidatus Limnocylindrales bacterium]
MSPDEEKPDEMTAADDVTADPTAAAPHDTADDEEIVDDEDDADVAPAEAWNGPSAARWLLFGAIAVLVIIADQLTKSWIVGSVDKGSGFSVIGDWLNFVYGENSGILFGMVPQSAYAFALVSLIVIVLIVVYHRMAGRGIVMTVATGLLLGGAIGNLIDRLLYGAVIDWIDMGIGTWRFWTYNIADAAITTSIILILLTALFPVIGEWGSDD